MYTLLILMVFVVIATMSAGIILKFKEYNKNLNAEKRLIKCSISLFIALVSAFIILMIPQSAHAADNGTGNAGLGYIAAALSTGLATVGTGIAVGSVGSSALGAVSENPKMLGRTLIFVGLGEGIAIYGLIVSILILGRI